MSSTTYKIPRQFTDLANKYCANSIASRDPFVRVSDKCEGSVPAIQYFPTRSAKDLTLITSSSICPSCCILCPFVPAVQFPASLFRTPPNISYPRSQCHQSARSGATALKREERRGGSLREPRPAETLEFDCGRGIASSASLIHRADLVRSLGSYISIQPQEE